MCCLAGRASEVQQERHNGAASAGGNVAQTASEGDQGGACGALGARVRYLEGRAPWGLLRSLGGALQKLHVPI